MAPCGSFNAVDVEYNLHRSYVQDFVDSAISRSGESLLSIYIGSLRRGIDRPEINALINASGRWHTVTMLNLEENFLRGPQLARVKGNLPNLRSLTLEIPYVNSDAKMDVFADAPCLTRLYLAVNPYECHPFVFPWHQLLDFTEEDPDAQWYLEQLERCSVVTSATLLYCTTGWYDLRYPDAEHPTLTTLEIIIDDIDYHLHNLQPHATAVLRILFQHLKAPNLRHLSLTSQETDMHYNFPIAELRQFASVGSHTLETLNLDRFHVTEPDLCLILAALPSLTHFTLKEERRLRLNASEGILVGDGLLKALKLKASPTAEDLVPKLNSLKLELGLQYVDEELMMEMIESRISFGCVTSMQFDI